jgi:hypothetical protein
LEKVGPLDAAKSKVEADVGKLLGSIREITSQPAALLGQKVGILTSLRETVYEDLNQIQHEYLILLGIEWLVANGIATEATEWFWNPRQNGGSDEPDLYGVTSGAEISAEVTTSKVPDGVIDTRMSKTLDNLAKMSGRQFYFVATARMLLRARTKIVKRGHAITAVQLGGAAVAL